MCLGRAIQFWTWNVCRASQDDLRELIDYLNASCFCDAIAIQEGVVTGAAGISRHCGNRAWILQAPGYC